ncbi:MAG: sugar phosphate isomerase/epimerase family protein [Blastocatellales bacterium]
MISRREFLAAVPVSLAGVVLSPSNSFAAPTKVKIGCQTNAWRIDPNNFNDLLGVLDKLKGLGYEGFETGFRIVQGQFANAADARKQLQQRGLKFFGCHIFLEQYDPNTHVAPMELVQKIAQGSASLGAERLILSGGGLLKGAKINGDDLKRKADGLNAAGKYCRSKGLKLAYHNHGPEFANGGEEIEGLYRLTDPSLVEFLTDCGWAYQGGANIPQFFEKHHKRIIGLHLRDFKNGQQVPLGQGEFPIRELAAAISKVNWAGWTINEEERLSGEKPGEKAVAPARKTLQQVFGK